MMTEFEDQSAANQAAILRYLDAEEMATRSSIRLSRTLPDPNPEGLAARQRVFPRLE